MPVFDGANLNSKIQSKVEKRRDTSNSYACWIPVAAAFICYISNIHGEFVHDDIFAIKNNKDVSGEHSVFGIFSDDYWGSPVNDYKSHKSYRPLTTLTFRWNYKASGGCAHTFHLVNNLLHCFVTFLVTKLCTDILGLPPKCSMLAALIFAVHPIHTEAVSGIVGRADILAAVFFILSVLSYKQGIGNGSLTEEFPHTECPPFILISMLCVILATFSKENGVMSAAVLVVYDIFCVCRIGVKRYLKYRSKDCNINRLLSRLACILFVFVSVMIYRVYIMGGTLPTFQPQDNPAAFAGSFTTRLLTFAYLPFFNIKLLLAPVNLSYDWQVGSIPLIDSITDVRNISSLCLYAAFMIMCLASIKLSMDPRHEKSAVVMLLSLSLVVFPFLPASNLFFTIGFVVAERLLYIPSIGFCILVSYGAHTIHEKFPSFRLLIKLFCVMLLLFFSVKTWKQNYVWTSRELLFKSGISTSLNNAKIHYNYANYLRDEKLTSDAIYHYREAIRLYPDDASYYNNLGNLLNNKTEAEALLRKAIELQPSHAGAHVNLGSCMFYRGGQEEGIYLLKKALHISPTYRDAQITLANMLAEIGRTDEAEGYFQEALRLHPDFAEAYYGYGLYLHSKGEVNDAVHYYKEALAINQNHRHAMLHAARGLKGLGKVQEAQTFLESALVLSRDTETLHQMGQFLYDTGRTSISLKYYEEIEKRDPNNTDALMQYGQVLLNIGEKEKSEAVFLQLHENNPQSVLILKELANLYGAMENYNTGVFYLNAAIEILKESNDSQQLADVYEQHGLLYVSLDNLQQAEQSFKSSISFNWNSETSHQSLGVIYHKNGNLKTAREHYSNALKINPNNTLTKINLRKLEKVENAARQRDKG